MTKQSLYDELERINSKPQPFDYSTVSMLWNDPYISQKMLELHLDDNSDLASRKKSFIASSVDWMVNHFDITPGSLICDFGCGPGLYTTLFAEHGAHVTGIDFSENSIRYARKVAEEKSLSVNYVFQDYLEYRSDEKYDLITMIYCDFCALSPSQRQILLTKFHDLLKNDGAIVLDVHSLKHYDSVQEKSIYSHSSKDFIPNFWSDKPYYVFTNTFKYEEEHLCLDKYVIIEEGRKHEIVNWLQCYSLESLKKEFQENGLDIIEHYSDVSGTPHNPDSTIMCVVARKTS